MLKTLSRAHLPTAFSVTLPNQLKAISQITKLKVLLHSSVVRADTTIRLSKHHIISFLGICLHSALFSVFSSDIQRVTQCRQLSKPCALPSALLPMSVNNNGREFFLLWATEYPFGATQNPLSLKRKIHLPVPLRHPTFRGECRRQCR